MSSFMIKILFVCSCKRRDTVPFFSFTAPDEWYFYRIPRHTVVNQERCIRRRMFGLEYLKTEGKSKFSYVSRKRQMHALYKKEIKQ